MTATSWICCRWYGVQARADGLWHLVRGHDLRWRTNSEPWIGCLGDIVCEACPDTTDRCGLVIWCRHSALLGWLAQRLCGWLGHPGVKQSERHVPNGGYVPSGEWYCERCLADRPTPL